MSNQEKYDVLIAKGPGEDIIITPLNTAAVEMLLFHFETDKAFGIEDELVVTTPLLEILEAFATMRVGMIDSQDPKAIYLIANACN